MSPRVKADLTAQETPGQEAINAAFLGVATSLTGRRWEERSGDSRTAIALAQRHGLPEVAGRVLASRGVGLEGAEAFLAPSLRAALPDPSRLQDMDRAAERLVAALGAREPIVIFADYDVDGATSAALLTRYLAPLGAAITTYVPDRINEGYGPNAEAMRALAGRGARVVVTVDCGITAFAALEAAEAAGLDVIVVDHHVAEPRLPPAHAVVNPNRLDDTSGAGSLAAVGVSFLLVVALNRALRAAGFFANRDEPDLFALLDLVALGTVCDMAPLKSLNRAFVCQGLRVLAKRANAGLVALADVAGVRERPTTYHLGFLMGPRVNAGGRVGEAGLGARLLSLDDAREAGEIARRLDAHNSERREIEASVFEAARAHVARDPAAESSALVFAVGEGWHPGVLGIVAGRLKEVYQRPAVVLALDGGVATGSGRSVDGVDLGSAVIAARQSGLAIKGGGHRMACGLTVARERLPALRAFLEERVHAESRGLHPRLLLDGALAVSGMTLELVEALALLAPYGIGNPEPRFALAGARVTYAEIVGQDHLRCALSGPGGGRIDAMAFRVAGQPLGQALLRSDGLPLHVAGRVRRDEWRGRVRVRFMLDDAATIG